MISIIGIILFQFIVIVFAIIIIVTFSAVAFSSSSSSLVRGVRMLARSVSMLELVGEMNYKGIRGFQH